MKISIIGVGLIGGSFALALKKRLEKVTVCGWDKNRKNLKKAEELDIVDVSAKNLEEAISFGDWVVLAIPVHAIESVMPECMNLLKSHQVLVDFGSTKKHICEVADRQTNRHQFIAAHPIAGTEYSGPGAAFADLFEGKVMIVCDAEKSDEKHLIEFRKMCKMTGMKSAYLSATDHDEQLAYISHLSHVIAFGLSNTVLKKEETHAHILDLAGSGFASTVRLAKSSPDMWTPVFQKNKTAVLESLDHYLSHLNGFRQMLDEGNEEGIRDFLNKGREIRKILD